MKAFARSAAIVAVAAGMVVGGGTAAPSDLPGIAAFRDRPAVDAGKLALDRAERLADDDAEVLLSVARVHLLSGDRSHARRIFARIERAPADLEQMRRIGLIYAEAGELDRADEYFRRVLAVDPKDAHALSQIGAALIRGGRRVEGEALLARALALDGKDERHYRRAAAAYLGVRATE